MFKVNWNSLETEALTSWTKDLLTSALNSGKSPSILASDITVKDLNFGKIAPDFEILEIGELDKDRFRGIFKINYQGDFKITLHTNVQANPLNIHYQNSLTETSEFTTPNFLLSKEPFGVPLDIALSNININGIGSVALDKSRGATMVFKNDPLQGISVKSSFGISVIDNLLQKEIEKVLLEVFKENIPTILHQVSKKFLNLNLEDKLPSESHNNNSSNTTLSVNSNLKYENENELVYSRKNLLQMLSLYNTRETMTMKLPKVLTKNILIKGTNYPSIESTTNTKPANPKRRTIKISRRSATNTKKPIKEQRHSEAETSIIEEKKPEKVEEYVKEKEHEEIKVTKVPSPILESIKLTNEFHQIGLGHNGLERTLSSSPIQHLNKNSINKINEKMTHLRGHEHFAIPPPPYYT
ncbi:hypothetical protein G210_4331 [Candida maltosa Xu316]|uniref:Mitochondrial distribution and morphology protein 34 n=1 Tax=Candida maltosa (strain Xu316) TaxID=1245528 RepID=M3J0W7_CANMX|nr:hypothetical protein G210_4331 [Candida maltosa Xu316]